MSFPRYPAYKPSGVEWLGEVPEHWNALPLRRLISEVSSGTSVNAIDEPASPGQPGVLKTSCVYTGEFRPEENKAILESELERASCPVVAGSLIVSRMNTPDLVGAAGLVKYDDPFLFLPDRLWQVTFQDCNPQFMNYWCKSVSYRSQVQLACSGTSSSMQNLSQDNFYSFIAPLPSKTEQLVIARFLDRETAKIEALITEQQRLIELLQEKRQAVISHAVTKGLNPNAPMKDSGVEWLGEVPEHWEVGPVKRFLSSMNYKRIPLSAEERATRQGEYPYYGASGIIDSVDEYLFEESLVLVSEDGANLLMRSTPIAFVASGKYWVNNHAHILKPNDEMPTFWSERIESLQIAPFVTGSAQPKLTAEALMNLTVAAPPKKDEKNAIEQRIQGAKAEFDPLLGASRKAIALLQERRSALISAAVTGQIDVRGLVEVEGREK